MTLIMKVRENKMGNSSSKLVTIPKSSPIKIGEYVRITKVEEDG